MLLFNNNQAFRLDNLFIFLTIRCEYFELDGRGFHTAICGDNSENKRVQHLGMPNPLAYLIQPKPI